MSVSGLITIAVVALLTIMMIFATKAEAQPLSRAGADLIRQSAEVGLRSPRPLDALRFEGATVGPLRRPPAIDDVALLRFLRQSDANLARAVEAADPTLRRATLEALEGARAIERALPTNPVRRAQIVESGGVELLRAAARPVDGLGDALLLLDGSMRAGRLPDSALTRFGSALDSHGEAFSRMWREYIVPNWEAVVGGGLVLALLIEPDRFIDTTGRLTSHAVAAFTGFGVEIGASVTEGIWRGIVRTVTRRIESGRGWTLLVSATVLFVAAAGWLVYRRRRAHRKSGRKA